MTKNSLYRTAAGLLAVNAVVHLALTPEYLGKSTWLGLSFVALAVLAGGLAVRLWARDDRQTLLAAAALSAAAFIAFVLTRTTGLLGFKEGEWELLGIVSLLVEAGVVGIWAREAMALPAGRTHSAQH